MDNQILLGIKKEQIDIVWDLIEPLLETCMEEHDGRFKTENLKDWLINGKMQCWCSVNVENDQIVAVCLTEIINYPCSKRLSIPFIVSNGLKKWEEFLGIILNWGKSLGCEAVELYGSKAWIRIFKNFNFTPKSLLITAKIR